MWLNLTPSAALDANTSALPMNVKDENPEVTSVALTWAFLRLCRTCYLASCCVFSHTVFWVPSLGSHKNSRHRSTIVGTVWKLNFLSDLFKSMVKSPVLHSGQGFCSPGMFCHPSLLEDCNKQNKQKWRTFSECFSVVFIFRSTLGSLKN